MDDNAESGAAECWNDEDCWNPAAAKGTGDNDGEWLVAPKPPIASGERVLEASGICGRRERECAVPEMKYGW